MNLQSHMSGQFVGQAPNQASNQLPGLLQSNGNLLNTQVQNMSGQNYLPMDPEMVLMRRYMRERIYEMLRLRQSNLTENILKRIQDFTRRLEDGLYRAAATKEEYMNLDTLEARLHAMVKRAPPANHVPQHSQFINNTASVATMMPIPGAGAGAGGTMSSTPSAGNLMPIGNAPFTGSLSNIGQQSASAFPMNSGVNNNMMAGQRPMNQMIPTPGLSGRNSQMLNNVDNFNNNGILSSADSLMASQQMLQRQASGQNNRMLPNLGRGMRSFAQHPFQNGIMNNVIGNNVRMVNDSGLSTSSFGVSSGSLFQSHGTLQQPLLQGDSSGSGSLFNIGTSVGSLLNNQNADQRTSSALVNSHLSQLNSQLSQSAAYLMQTNARQYQQLHQMPQQQQFTTYPQQRQLSDLLAHPLEASAQQRQPSDYSQISVRNEGFQLQSMSDNGNPVTSEYAMDHQNEVFQQSFPGDIQVSELQNQLQYNSNEDISRDNQLSFIPSNSEPMMVDNDGVNEFGKPPFEAQQDVLLNLSHEQGAQEEFCQEIVGHANAQRINLPSEISSNDQIVAPGHVADQPKSGSGGMSSNGECDQNYRNQLRWLLFLRHARSCGAPPGKCLEPNCITVQKLLDHMDSCKAVSCSYPRCAKSSKLLNHQSSCRDYNCPVCAPYHKFIHAQKKLSARRDREAAEAKPTETLKPSETTVLPPEDTPIKRMKSELSSQFRSSENGSMYATVNAISASQPLQSVQSSENGKSDGYLQFKSEYRDLQADISNGSNQNNTDIENPSADIVSCQQFESDSVLNHVGSSPEEEIDKFVKENDQMKPEEEAHPSVDVSYRQRSDGVSVLNHVDSLPKEETDKHVKESGKLREEAGQPSEEVVTKSGKPNIKGVSLIELFTPEQVREHIYGLRRWVGQSKAKAERNQAMKQIMSENACQLCAVEKLSFEPPPIYCTPCGARIKRNAMYYTVGAGETRHVFCIPCYNESRGDAIVVDGTAIPKGRMEKKKNDEETEEWWVQCDKCEAWQHQICALFNGRRNDGGQAEYTCPNCYMQEVEQGERAPLPQSAVLGAKDLPTTVLSDHIEKRLARRLRQERLERARSLGKSYDEVPGADGIVVRVVSSVDKKLEVKPRFLEIFREENYPLEFPYKSKVVLLFQKIEGVEVCLYGMYVQEFGSECLQPNQRRVYLSYLDSVKYFRPEVRTVTGEALRTFVYHEILIGYLEYCKKRGFASCYIWACPPLKGEDYILYCHPEIQKTPKSDKLREWYLGMLRKAMRENIVVDLTNLYEHFFIQTGESKAKVTAARLPYFDGDYWPGAAEDMINQIIQEEEGRRLNKKGVTKKMITKRALKASGHLDLSSNASKDILLMHRLGETIAPMKEDFIMVHLQHACTHCCVLMVSGNRWVCELCKKFQLCDRCYAEEQRRDHRERHPVNQKDKHAHALKKIEVSGVTEDTKDTDDILESEFFDTRQAFLSLCQGNHYQYDTLRRAKHSSMMVLYHLHNPTAPAFVTTCNICHLDIETGQGWRCETCPEYDVCNACYKKDGGVDHPHKLTSYPSTAERDAQNKEARQIRVVQLRKMLELLVHASLCRSAQCQYPNCRKVKGLFRHGIQCKTRASGGCVLCKRMWYLLQLHARACKESECNVPRCRDLKDHLRRLQQQSDSRRRAAVNEMMRQRAQEVAGN